MNHVTALVLLWVALSVIVLVLGCLGAWACNRQEKGRLYDDGGWDVRAMDEAGAAFDRTWVNPPKIEGGE